MLKEIRHCYIIFVFRNFSVVKDIPPCYERVLGMKSLSLSLASLLFTHLNPPQNLCIFFIYSKPIYCGQLPILDNIHWLFSYVDLCSFSQIITRKTKCQLLVFNFIVVIWLIGFLDCCTIFVGEI